MHSLYLTDLSFCFQVYNQAGEHVSTTQKMKGFTLKANVQEQLQFDTMKEQVDNFLAGREAPVEVDDVQIRRCGLGRIQTVYRRKKYKAVFNKRIALPDYCTVPFGYLGELPEGEED